MNIHIILISLAASGMIMFNMLFIGVDVSMKVQRRQTRITSNITDGLGRLDKVCHAVS